jgi:hypothetical protein
VTAARTPASAASSCIHPQENPLADDWIAIEPDQQKPASSEHSPLDRWADVLTVVILSLATLLTAWSGYQAAIWSGIQSSKYSEASAKRIEASRAATRADQLLTIDVTVFSDYMNAYATGQDDLASFYEERFRPEFQPAFDAWLATNPDTNLNAPSTPFSLPEYRLADADRAIALEAQATALFDEGEEANDRGDRYVLVTVILASVLFFAGISTRIDWYPARYGIIAVGLVLFFYGIIRLLTMPIHYQLV